jgi:hypothetical protein
MHLLGLKRLCRFDPTANRRYASTRTTVTGLICCRAESGVGFAVIWMPRQLDVDNGFAVGDAVERYAHVNVIPGEIVGRMRMTLTAAVAINRRGQILANGREVQGGVTASTQD